MSTDLVTLSVAEYPIMAGGGDIAKTIKANLAGEQVTPADLTRIKVPAGGATTWAIPGPDGEESSAKALEGIIVYTCRRRAYWPNQNPSGDPPQCSSADCLTGVGDPGGNCEPIYDENRKLISPGCPFDAWGSANKGDGTAGRGKACKESRLMFLLRPGCTLPEVVVVPPGSLKACKQYLLKLGLPYWAVVTRLMLVRRTNKDNIAYAEINPVKAGVLDAEAAKAIMAYAQELQSVFQAVTVDRTDVESEG